MSSSKFQTILFIPRNDPWFGSTIDECEVLISAWMRRRIPYSRERLLGYDELIIRAFYPTPAPTTETLQRLYLDYVKLESFLHCYDKLGILDCDFFQVGDDYALRFIHAGIQR